MNQDPIEYLKFINKGVTVEENLKAAKICKELKIKIWANYMFGLPGESLIEMIKTALMINKINPDHNSPALFTPYPKTHLYEYCNNNNLLLIEGYKEYRRDFSQRQKNQKCELHLHLFISILNIAL